MTEAQIKNPENVLEEISRADLLHKVMIKKEEGFRFSQACAAYINEKLELSYSFMNEDTFEFFTYRVIVEKGEEVPSITQIVPAAVFHENEMKELFGVNIKMISIDFDDKLYRIETETPFVPADKEESK